MMPVNSNFRYDQSFIVVILIPLVGNDSNLLIVFYVQIMPDDFVMQLHRFWERQRLPSQPCQVLPQIQVMPLNSLRISLADYVQLSLQAGFIQRPVIRHPYHHVKGWQQAHKTPQRRHSAFTEYVRNNRLPEPVIRVKQPALARFSPDIAPLFVHFRADDDVTAWLYARGYRLRPEFFKWRKIVLRPTPIMRAVARHPTPFMAISMIFWCVPGWEAV